MNAPCRAATAAAAVLLLLAPACPARAASAPRESGPPINVEDATAEATAGKWEPLWPFDRPIYDWLQQSKKELKKRYGFEWALEYTIIYQATSGGIDPKDAMEGTLSLSALWRIWRDPNGIDSAGVGFQFEQRGTYTNDRFQDMTAGLGTLWSPNDSTSNDYWKVNQLWWAQKMFDGKVTYLLGKIDPGAHINGNRFAGSGNTQFFGQPWATNPARAFPDNGLGAMVKVAPVDWLWVHGVISDSDAVSTHSPFGTWSGNLFYAGELGFKFKLPDLGEGNYRLMLWQRVTDSDTGTGFSLSFDQNLGPDFGVFLRYGVNGGDLIPVEQIAAAGLSLLRPFGRHEDQAGIAIAWTRPSDSSLRDEYAAEVYYRLQLTRGMELSGSVQAVKDPSASDQDWTGVFGLRMRFLF